MTYIVLVLGPVECAPCDSIESTGKILTSTLCVLPSVTIFPSETEREFGRLASPFRDITNKNPFESDSEEEYGMPRRASIMEASPIEEWSETKWSRLRQSLCKDRKVRQYYTKSTLVREAFIKKVEYEELLLDLCIVFNIAFLSHTLKSNIAGSDIEFQFERFALLLGLVFVAWRSNALRFNLLTTEGTDLLNKLEVLVLMVSFTGIGFGAPMVYDAGTGRFMTPISGFIVLALPSAAIIIGAWQSPLRHDGKLGIWNHAVIRGILQLICAIPYALICVFPVSKAKSLYYIGFLSNFCLDFVADMAFRKVFGKNEDTKFYAVCIETWTERHALLTLVSFGESALTLLYVVDGMMRNPENREKVGSIFLSIMCLFILLYSYVTQYFEIDNRIASGHGARHAVRRGVFSGIAWSLTHYFMIFGLVAVAVGYGVALEDWFGSAGGHIILSESTGSGRAGNIEKANGSTELRIGLFLVCSETIVALALVGLSACHRSSDHEVTKPYRLGIRALVFATILIIVAKFVDGPISQGTQWGYTALQGIMTVLEFALVRMDAASWFKNSATTSIRTASTSHHDISDLSERRNSRTVMFKA